MTVIPLPAELLPSGTPDCSEALRPTRKQEAGHPMRFPIWPCSLRGLPSCSSHPEHWCALTAPFHPYRDRERDPRVSIPARSRRYVFCGTFLRVAAIGYYPAQCPEESGLTSPLLRGERPPFLLRPPGKLTHRLPTVNASIPRPLACAIVSIPRRVRSRRRGDSA